MNANTRVEAIEEHPLATGEDVVRLRKLVRDRAVALGLSLVDQTKVVTAASELGRNTIQYGGGGKVVIASVSDGRRRGVRLEFIDEGPGIPEDRLNIIFDRFYTDRPATEAARGKNSGLGLSISREIIRAHGGEILASNRYAAGAETDKPLGAMFTVRLPALLLWSQRTGVTSGRRPISDGPNEQYRDRA